jgi:hypothetical protein
MYLLFSTLTFLLHGPSDMFKYKLYFGNTDVITFFPWNFGTYLPKSLQDTVINWLQSQGTYIFICRDSPSIKTAEKKCRYGRNWGLNNRQYQTASVKIKNIKLTDISPEFYQNGRLYTFRSPSTNKTRFAETATRSTNSSGSYHVLQTIKKS